jgi:hypothetical protein
MVPLRTNPSPTVTVQLVAVSNADGRSAAPERAAGPGGPGVRGSPSAE